MERRVKFLVYSADTAFTFARFFDLINEKHCLKLGLINQNNGISA